MPASRRSSASSTTFSSSTWTPTITRTSITATSCRTWRTMFSASGPWAENIVLHVRQDVAVMLVLVMVGVHVDDDKVVELALDRLLAGVGEKPGGVQLVDRYASAAFSEEVHRLSPDVSKIRLRIPRGRTRA